MNPVPFALRFVFGWKSIRKQLNTRAAELAIPPYAAQPELYQFDGWGAPGFPPRLACNVKYLGSNLKFEGEEYVDLGRFVA